MEIRPLLARWIPVMIQPGLVQGTDDMTRREFITLLGGEWWRGRWNLLWLKQ
jgi:hypothetical protein